MHARQRAVLPLAAMLLAAPCFATVAGAQVVLDGRVRDDVTGERIPGARVLLLDRQNRTIGYAVTDDSGHFRFTRHNGGWYRFDVRAIGYERVRTPVLRWMVDHNYAQLEVRLAPHVALLAPLEVVALSPALSSPVLENMVQRRLQPFGIEISRADIERRHPATLADMLTEVPGVYAVRRGNGSSSRTIYMGGALYGPGGAACPAQIFLDGHQMTRNVPGGDVAIDEIADPQDVEQIEVFRGLSSIPPEFLTPEARCGVIAIWTKRAR